MLIMVFIFPCSAVYAWSQSAHQQINQQVVDNFLAQSENSDKFSQNPIDTNKEYAGRGVISATYMRSKMMTKTFYINFAKWVAHGGYSADEPEIEQALNHFYDPVFGVGLQMKRDWMLMPQFAFDYVMKTEADSNKNAKTWGLTDPANPFSYVSGLKYYKAAMEVHEPLQGNKMTDYKAPAITIPGEDKREGGTVAFNDMDKVRDFYLGKSFRALGETMHLLGDMTQPAHVRNDAHGYSDPLEDTLTAGIVKDKAQGKLVNVALPDDPDQLFHSVAAYVNRHFFTDDTIYGSFYEAPKIEKLTVVKGNILFNVIDGVQVPVAERTLSTWIYGVEEFSEMEGYTVSSSITRGQASVLVPIAIKANEKLIQGFFPTMELNLGSDEVQIPVAGQGTRTAYRIKADMKHLVDQDPVWRKYGLTINFCGPGRLIKVSGGQESRLADLYLENGTLIGYRLDKTKAFAQQPLVIVAGNLPQSDDYLTINNEDKIYLVVEAGGRTFKTEPMSLEFYELALTPKNYQGKVGDTMRLTGTLNKTPDSMSVRWNFGDGTVQTTNGLSQSHVYSKAGQYNILVEVFGPNQTIPVAKQNAVAVINDKPVNNHDEKITIPQQPDSQPAAKTSEPVTSKETKAKPAAPVEKEYDYNAALAAWMADTAAKENSKKFDDGYCRTTCNFEWVVAPYIKNGSVYGASRLWYNDVYYAGPKAGTTQRYVSSETFDAGNPGVFLSLGDLRRLYPKL